MLKLLSTVFALALIALGVSGYLVTGQESATALIPAFIGVVVLAVIFLVKNSVWRYRVVVILALLGIGGTARSMPALFNLLTGGDEARPAALICQGLMALICVIYIVMRYRCKK